MNPEETENLFSYGTLQEEAVQLATFGRLLEGRPDSLVGYAVTQIPIKKQEVVARTGNTHYRNLQFTGAESDLVEGTVFKVTLFELEQADVYEQEADYKRVRVRLRSGAETWVYLLVEMP